VDPFPDPLLLRKSGNAGNRIQTSGSVASNFNHYTTEVVSVYYRKKNYILIASKLCFLLVVQLKLSFYLEI
jgi:hypothetical protein